MFQVTMAPAGMVKIQAAAPTSTPSVLELGPILTSAPAPLPPHTALVQLGAPALPSPASDATTSTKDTVTPALKSKTKVAVKKTEEEKKEEKEKTSTVAQKKPRGRPRKEEVEEEQEVLRGSELELDSEDDEEEGEEGRKVRTGGVKLSSLLPKGMGKASTPASSSKRGSSTPRAPPVKRKREEGAETPVARVKKMKGKVASDSEDTEGEQVCGEGGGVNLDMAGCGLVYCMHSSFPGLSCSVHPPLAPA